jgi:hypothetical protein
MPDSPPLPPGWSWFEAILPDGRRHRFALAHDTPMPALHTRAWQIWSPARAGSDGRFLAPGLSVERVSA